MAEREIISTDRAAAPVAFYSQAVAVGNLVYTAGCVGVDPETGTLEQGGFEPQVRRTFRNAEVILLAAGSSFDRVVKTSCYLKRMEDFATFDRLYR